MLQTHTQALLLEAGCDEAGRGCLAGPVFAAAVILPIGYGNPALNDSKKLKAPQREALRGEIENDALAWAVASVSEQEIDEINILQASLLAMHRAIASLSVLPELLLIDGNRFKPYQNVPHECLVKGDGRIASIAAASILAKTHRDAYMMQWHQRFPMYGWDKNKGYGTAFHIQQLQRYGSCEAHRKTFRWDKKTEEGKKYSKG